LCLFVATIKTPKKKRIPGQHTFKINEQ
jgi:hypothetical protein